jgi:hypothetical protein
LLGFIVEGQPLDGDIDADAVRPSGRVGYDVDGASEIIHSPMG